jgi:hypothetical protein
LYIVKPNEYTFLRPIHFAETWNINKIQTYYSPFQILPTGEREGERVGEGEGERASEEPIARMDEK